MRIKSAEELMHTGPAAMREYCKSLASSLRDATEDRTGLAAALRDMGDRNAKLRKTLAALAVDVELAAASARFARKLLEGEDADV